MKIKYFILTIIIFICIITENKQAIARPIPYRILRYENVVGQADWFTCGAASIATLLKYYYGIDTTESEILNLAIKAMEGTGKDPRKNGLTLLSMQQALTGKNIRSKGLKISPQDLKNYFQKGGLPLILHVTKPQLHYIVAIGMINDWLIIADPSWGRRILPLNTLIQDKGFEGIVLITIPQNSQINQIKINQFNALKSAENRLENLTNVRQKL
ncbi:MAG TPA: cysteine peptidase family C39 domain-containing protein [Allocoleopsis sp.]